MAIASGLVKSFEGCRLEAYQCPAGKWTVGYGHTGPDVHEGLVISQQQADAFLAADLERFAAGVARFVTRPLSAQQTAALISFAFNEGLGRFSGSTLLVKVNAGLDQEAAREFGKWIYCNKEILTGLVRRRAAEAALYDLV
jgi:lysozyme